METSGSWFASIRFRVLALIALVAVPLLVATTYSYVRGRDEAEHSVQAHALNTALLVQHEYQLRVDAAQQLVTPGFPFSGGDAVAQVMANPQQCNTALGDILKRNTGYTNLFEIDLKGNIFCSAVPQPGVNVGDRDYFRETLRTLKPAVGSPIIGRVTNKSAIVVDYPVFGSAGELTAVAAAGIDLSTVVLPSAAVDLPAASSVTLLDPTGTVLARNLDSEKWVGKSAAPLVGLSSAVASGKSGTAVGAGVDGVPRLYGFVPMRPAPGGPSQGTLLVGIPTSTAYGPSDAAFRWNLVWLGTATLVAVLAGWFGSGRFVVRPLRQVAETAGRIAHGDFATPTGVAGTGGEIGMLGAAMDDMAAQLAASRAELAQERLDSAEIVSTAASVIAITDADGTVIRVNPTIEVRFGWSPSEFTGRDVNALLDEPVLPRRDGVHGRTVTEGVARRRDGTSLPMEIDVREVGTLSQRYIVVLRDLTDRARLEAERELGKVAEARAQFLRTLGHELRSPLTAVLGFAQLLSEEPLTPRGQRQAKDIEEAGHHMLSLVNDLLELERIDAGRWDVNITEVHVEDVVTSVTAGLRPLALERGLAVSEEVVPPGAVALTDSRALREIATNLIENAIKYTERGTVSVSAHVDSDSLVLEVSDTGVGIPSDHIDSIFSEFEQLRPMGTQAGTGLGLAITRRLVALIGGTIRVDSVLGLGSVFTVEIPITTPARNHDPATA